MRAKRRAEIYAGKKARKRRRRRRRWRRRRPKYIATYCRISDKRGRQMGAKTQSLVSPPTLLNTVEDDGGGDRTEKGRDCRFQRFLTSFGEVTRSTDRRARRGWRSARFGIGNPQNRRRRRRLAKLHGIKNSLAVRPA